MLGLSNVASASLIIQLATAVAAGATGAAAYKGYRATGSPTFLRLFGSFLFLALGLLIEAISPTISDTVLSAALMIVGSALEAAGYFLLALSHFFTVRSDISALGTMLLVPATSVSALNSINLMERVISLYLLLYISAETVIFLFQNRSALTLVSVSGLLLITMGVLLDLFVSSTAGFSFIFDAVRLAGFVVLLSPATILLRHRPGDS